MQNDQNAVVAPKKKEEEQNVVPPCASHSRWPQQETRVVTHAGVLPYKEALEWDHD